MYLRETRRRNGDGSEVSYLALAHNERDPVTGTPKAKIIYNFGRADSVDKEALARLVRSISRFLEPGEAVEARPPRTGRSRSGRGRHVSRKDTLAGSRAEKSQPLVRPPTVGSPRPDPVDPRIRRNAQTHPNTGS